MLPPGVVREHDDVCRAGPIIVGCEQAAERRPHPKRRETVTRERMCVDRCHMAVDVNRGPRRQEPTDAVEETLLPNQVDGRAKNPARTAVDADRRNAHQGGWLAHGYGPEEHVRQRENGRVRADAEGE